MLTRINNTKQWEILASKYAEDTTLFGPKNIKPIKDGEDRDEYLKRQEVDKLKIRKGYSIVLEKIKALRQKFSSAVISGRPSGSGKFSGSGSWTGQAEESQEQGVDISGNSGLGNNENEYDSDDSLTNSLGNNVDSTSTSASNESTSWKHPVSNPVPMLVDDK
ncbi:Hypothetical predicted protein [Paramuricea clavata]|uniref:Uncharacterized protein n=1 Tax=Paramuricea clavata TaxID=317549 RepID=A0A6S7I4V5_PARCT|nr:Hypothetical predicted protein [Paramuricea clavata]